jgi:hypothetical protein
MLCNSSEITGRIWYFQFLNLLTKSIAWKGVVVHKFIVYSYFYRVQVEIIFQLVLILLILWFLFNSVTNKPQAINSSANGCYKLMRLKSNAVRSFVANK